MKNVLIAFIGILLISSCKKKDESIAVDGVTLPSAAVVAVEATVKLTAAVTPDDAADTSLKWTSSDDDIAMVADGTVTGKSPGAVTVTAASRSNPAKFAVCAVTVTANPVPLTGLGVEPALASIPVKGAQQLVAVFTPEKATDKVVTWTSSNEAVATVDGNGLVTAQATGSASIKVTSVSDKTKTATCVVTVADAFSHDASVSGITLGNSDFEGMLFAVPVPDAGETAVVKNAPRIIASALKTLGVTITAAPNSSITIGDADFLQGQRVDFTHPVTFTVTAQDRTTVSAYTVDVVAYDATSNPYGVYTAVHLNDVRNNKAGSYKMMNNIVLPARNAEGAAAIGIPDYAEKGWLPIAHEVDIPKKPGFTGKFDGGSFSIDNFYVNRTDVRFTGLFGAALGAAISNVGITGNDSPAVTGSYSAGALVAILAGGSVVNCYANVAVRVVSDGTEDAICAGGLLGLLKRGASISNSYSSGNVSGYQPAVEGGLCIGGLIGSATKGEITKLISVPTSEEDTSISISNCFATGNITASAAQGIVYGGGLAGWLSVGTANCYARGDVACKARKCHAGYLGFIGSDKTYTHTNCYRNSEAAITEGEPPVAAAAPSDGDARIAPKTKAEMQTDAFTALLNNGASAWGRDDSKNDKLPYIIGVGVGK